jgi:hypothetical protein
MMREEGSGIERQTIRTVDMSGKYMIPTKALLSAFGEWATSGELSPQVKWTTDIY